MEDNNGEPQYYDEYEIDLREYIMLLWNKKWFIAAFVIIAVMGAFIYSNFFITPSYETSAQIRLANIDGIYSDTSSVEQILLSTNLVREVKDELNIEISNSRLRSYINNNINASNVNNTSIISLNVRSDNPETAKLIAQEILHKFKQASENYFSIILSNKEDYIQILRNDIEEIEETILENKNMIELNRENNNFIAAASLTEENASLSNEKRNLRNQIQREERALIRFNQAEIIDSAYLPENPSSPNIKLNIAISAVLAVMLAVFIIFSIEFMKEDE